MTIDIIGDEVFGMARVEVISDPAEIIERGSPLGKPFLRLHFTHGDTVSIVDVTTNLAEMLGGAGKGTRERFEGSIFR